MINTIYQLITPRVIAPRKKELDLNGVIIRPTHMTICHADQRYFRGLRSKKILSQKLPMALIHEAVGVVVKDDSNTYKLGQKVVMIPNVPALNGDDMIAENYQRGSKFLSSGIDGFMQEYINMPADRIVPYSDIPDNIASMTEFISVGCHSIARFTAKKVTRTDRIGIWGDGNLGYVIANLLKKLYPKTKLIIIGQNQIKLDMFSFASEVYVDSEIPADLTVDHAFECTGGQGCESAIDSIIHHINPEGNIMLMGVSENSVPIYTRDVLEKGLTIVGNSRSGKKDFENAIELLRDKKLQSRLNLLISDIVKVSKVEDIIKAFDTDASNMYRTVIKWNM